jgi:hypothetical protein
MHYLGFSPVAFFRIYPIRFVKLSHRRSIWGYCQMPPLSHQDGNFSYKASIYQLTSRNISIKSFRLPQHLCHHLSLSRAYSTATRMHVPAIAIIGGGPSGLVLARLLEVNGITDYVVFERDESSTPGPNQQGGTLDLHESSGQLALKRAGLFDTFSKDLARWDAACFRLLNSAGDTIANFSDIGDRPEIDRFQLRHLLLDSIPSEKIRWNHAVKSVEKSCPSDRNAFGGNGCVIHFTNGTSASGFRLVVGADGVWSKVRSLVSTYSRHFFHIDCITNSFFSLFRSPPPSRPIQANCILKAGSRMTIRAIPLPMIWPVQEICWYWATRKC